MRKSETSSHNSFEEPIQIAFDYDEATGLYHAAMNEQAYRLFQEFIDFYSGNVAEELLSASKN